MKNLSGFLPIHEDFYTIQGEGFYSGRAAYFIRTEGCDVECSWCDVKSSWDINPEHFQDPKELVAKVIESGTELCVITGGEPCMHDFNELTTLLKQAGIESAIETSGTHPLKGKVDWYTFSPKKFKMPIPEAYELANELKIVINHSSDFEWAEHHAKLVKPTCKRYLQPEWTRGERFLPSLIEYVKAHPEWRISLQTHKFMKIP